MGDDTARADNADDVASVTVIVGGSSRSGLDRLTVRAAAAPVGIPAEALLIGNAAREIGMRFIDSRIENGNGDPAAGVSEGVDAVAADEGNALGHRGRTADIWIDAPDERIGLQPFDCRAVNLGGECGNVVPSSDEREFLGCQLPQDRVLRGRDGRLLSRRFSKGNDDRNGSRGREERDGHDGNLTLSALRY
jgi:hypothetical protein